MDGWMVGRYSRLMAVLHISRQMQHSTKLEPALEFEPPPTHPLAHHSTPPSSRLSHSLAVTQSLFFLKRQRPSRVACSGWVLGAGLSAAMILSKLTGAESLDGAG